MNEDRLLLATLAANFRIWIVENSDIDDNEAQMVVNQLLENSVDELNDMSELEKFLIQNM